MPLLDVRHDLYAEAPALGHGGVDMTAVTPAMEARAETGPSAEILERHRVRHGRHAGVVRVQVISAVVGRVEA